MIDIREDAFKYIQKELTQAKLALGRAEVKPNVTKEELDNLQKKIAVLDWLTSFALSGNPKPKRESRALKPCPICGKTSRGGWLHVWFHSSMDGKFQFIRCNNCGYTGERAKSEIQARRNWNDGAVRDDDTADS